MHRVCSPKSKKKMKNPDMHRSSNRKPHKQLKTIRERLGITQKTAAALLDVSYPYYLAIETGQRELSRSLADKMRETFGVIGIEDKAAAPEIALGKGERAPFTKERYEARLAKRPSFYIEADEKIVTPAPADYARCAHALLAAAEERKRLKPVVAGFVDWCRRNINNNAMLNAFGKSFKELFPGELTKSDAFSVAIEHLDRQLDEELVTEYERRTARNERQRKKNRRK